jgi:hypothetical protein
VASVKGCYLESFDFNIITCNPGTLPVRLAYFRNAGSSNGKHYLEWLLQEVQNLQSVIVEKGNREGVFVRERVLPNTGDRGTKQFSVPLTATPDYPLYRLRIVQKNGTAFYSNVIRLQEGASPELVRLGPNPATNQLDIQLNGMDGKTFVYSIIGINGTIAGRGTVQVHGNRATVSIPLHHIGPGTYQLQLAGGGAGSQPISLRFVKH